MANAKKDLPKLRKEDEAVVHWIEALQVRDELEQERRIFHAYTEYGVRIEAGS